jgi:hypothetical protein
VFVQHGCAGGGQNDRRMPNVGTAADGVDIFVTCHAACAAAGYAYFGLECPMATSTHCQCYTDERVANLGLTAPSDASCAASRGHCSNTATLTHDGKTYELGGAGRGSIYSLSSPPAPPSPPAPLSPPPSLPPLPAPPAPSPTVVDGFTFVGCYRDNGNRDLPHGPGGGRSYTPAQCNTACAAAGFKYFALQHGAADCWCDDSYSTPASTYPQIDLAKCQRGPTFNPYHGGPWTNAVFVVVSSVTPAKKRSSYLKAE